MPVALIVSRDCHLRRLLTHSLDGSGGDASGAATGAEGIARVEATRVDLVIVDLSSDPSEEALLQRLRAEPPGLRVIGLAGRFCSSRLERPSRARLDVCLRKPFRLDELTDVVSSWLFEDAAPASAARVALN